MSNKSFFYFLLISLNIISFSSPLCTEGENFCKKCNPVTKLCEKCIFDILIPDKNGGCTGQKKCTVGKNYCSECSSDNKLCKKCENNFYPDENGGCSYINNCEFSSQGKCLKCKEDFILVGDKVNICKSLNSEEFLNCANIDNSSGLCNKCNEGYYLTTGDFKCIKTQYCHEASYGVCTKCSMSNYLDKSVDECKMKTSDWLYCQQTVDGINCDLCDDDAYFDDEGKCIAVNYCAKGAAYAKCEKCKENYYLSKYGNTCTKESNCNYGDKDLGICTQCNNFFYIDFNDGKCKPNNLDNDFKYCFKADKECYDCVSGTYLGEDKKCSTSKNCAESNYGTCKYCITGYHLGKDKICNNIDKCVLSNYYNTCEECEEGYYFNITSNECEKEYEGFYNCVKTNSFGQYCDKCRLDFYLNYPDHKCYSNLEHNEFYKCAFTYGEECHSCVPDYYLGYIDKKCTKIQGCEISENENKCIKCDSESYCLNVKTGNCLSNEYIEVEEDKFYYRCNYTNEEGTECAECIDNYRLNDKKLCVFDDFCEEFDQNKKCKKCIQDKQEEYIYYCLNDDFDCTVTYTKGCELCNNVTNFEQCDKCKDGYTLQDGECVENK